MIKTYLKYRSIEEILDVLQIKPFAEYRKQKLTQVLVSDDPLDYKLDVILKHRGCGNTLEMLVHAIYKAQEERVLVLVNNCVGSKGLDSYLNSLLNKLDLNVKDNIIVKSVNQSYVGFNHVFIDPSANPTQDQLDSLKQVNLFYKPVS